MTQPEEPREQPDWGSVTPPTPTPGQQHFQQPYASGPPKHPQATTALVLGIIGIAACGLVAPFAWVIGNTAVREIDANPGGHSGRSEANAGRIMGIIGTALLGVALLGFLLFFVVIGAALSV